MSPTARDLRLCWRSTVLVMISVVLLLCSCSTVVVGTPVPAGPLQNGAVPGPGPTPVAQRIAELLTKVAVVPKLPNVPGYDRSCSPGDGCVFGTAWKDVERTGCDTRNRVLAAQLRDVVFKPGTGDCKVISGVLVDPYTGTTLQFGGANRADIEIDHVFALARAWDAGAAGWTHERREGFANDLDNLLAVSGSENQSKSASGPDRWLPPNKAFVCPYVEKYLGVAVEYGLSITAGDRDVAESACPV